MKPGDVVKLPPVVDRAVIHSIDGDEAEIWWPCPEYGSHTRIVKIADLVSLGEKYSRPRPARTKHHKKDRYRHDRDLEPAEPNPAEVADLED